MFYNFKQYFPDNKEYLTAGCARAGSTSSALKDRKTKRHIVEATKELQLHLIETLSEAFE